MKRTGNALSRGCGGTPAKGWMTLLLALILLPEPFAVDMNLPDAKRAPHAIEKSTRIRTSNLPIYSRTGIDKKGQT